MQRLLLVFLVAFSGAVGAYPVTLTGGTWGCGQFGQGCWVIPGATQKSTPEDYCQQVAVANFCAGYPNYLTGGFADLLSGGSPDIYVCRYWKSPTHSNISNCTGVMQAVIVTCPNGGTVNGNQCLCAAGETDNGYACVRSAGPCAVYPANTTTGCNKTTADLRRTMPPTTDAKFSFHSALACVTEAACAKRCSGDNCKWLEQVLPSAVAPYLRLDPHWQQPIRDCAFLSLPQPQANILCTGRLRLFHIQKDFTDALVKHGCGSLDDWNATFGGGLETACPITNETSSLLVYKWTEKARAQCIARRKAAGETDLTIETPLKGKTCGP